MKILLISPFPPRKDGIADYTARLAHAYVAEGHEVRVVATGGTDDELVLGHLTYAPRAARETWGAVRSWRPDAVHVQHTIATYGALLGALWLMVARLRHLKIPVLVTHHEVTRDIARLRSVGEWYYRQTLRLTKVVHVHTSQAGKVVRELGHAADDVMLVPHPVYPLPATSVTDAELRERYGLGDRKILLLFGYVHVEKGLHELIEGLLLLSKRRPELRRDSVVVVAGAVRPRSGVFKYFGKADEEYLAEAHRLVSRFDLIDSVVFTGHVPAAEVGAWFTSADAVLLPYTHTEQSGVANLAVAAGRPVVASRSGGLVDLFGESDRSFPSLSPEDVYKTLAAHLDLSVVSGDRHIDAGRRGDPRAAAAQFVGRLNGLPEVGATP